MRIREHGRGPLSPKSLGETQACMAAEEKLAGRERMRI